ncbi:tRNA splicing endonuclease subunit sen2, variant 3 [Basidiobolus ranarum]
MSKPVRSKRISKKIRQEYSDSLPVTLIQTTEVPPDCQTYSIFTYISTCLSICFNYSISDINKRIPVEKPIGVIIGNAVWVLKREHIEYLWTKGFFGKGILSRSEPNWKQRQTRKLLSSLEMKDKQLTQGPNQVLSPSSTKKRQERQLKYKTKEHPTESTVQVAEQEAQKEDNSLVKNTESTSQSSLPLNKDSLPLEMQAPFVEDLEYLQLSPEEAMFLRGDIKAIDLLDQNEKPYSIESCWKKFKGRNDDRPDNEFIVNYAVYHYYRSRGWVVKNGIKYGTDYVLYRKGPIFHHSE